MTRPYPDAYLDHYAELYVQRGAKRYGITLDQFLAQPEAILRRLDRLQAAAAHEQTPKQHRQERREENLVQQRGAVMLFKIWRGSRNGNRRNKPLPTVVR